MQLYSTHACVHVGTYTHANDERVLASWHWLSSFSSWRVLEDAEQAAAAAHLRLAAAADRATMMGPSVPLPEPKSPLQRSNAMTDMQARAALQIQAAQRRKKARRLVGALGALRSTPTASG